MEGKSREEVSQKMCRTSLFEGRPQFFSQKVNPFPNVTTCLQVQFNIKRQLVNNQHSFRLYNYRSVTEATIFNSCLNLIKMALK
jgi:hypothetical protein